VNVITGVLVIFSPIIALGIGVWCVVAWQSYKARRNVFRGSRKVTRRIDS
jgi:hypothetical protein